MPGKSLPTYKKKKAPKATQLCLLAGPNDSKTST